MEKNEVSMLRMTMHFKDLSRPIVLSDVSENSEEEILNNLKSLFEKDTVQMINTSNDEYIVFKSNDLKVIMFQSHKKKKPIKDNIFPEDVFNLKNDEGTLTKLSKEEKNKINVEIIDFDEESEDLIPEEKHDAIIINNLLVSDSDEEQNVEDESIGEEDDDYSDDDSIIITGDVSDNQN